MIVSYKLVTVWRRVADLCAQSVMTSQLQGVLCDLFNIEQGSAADLCTGLTGKRKKKNPKNTSSEHRDTLEQLLQQEQAVTMIWDWEKLDEII